MLGYAGSTILGSEFILLVCESTRLRLRHFDKQDAAFIVQQLNEPSFIRNIADRGVRNEQDADEFLRNGPLASYAQNGHGMYAVELKSDGTVIGMCGLLKRDKLPHADLGYAFLPAYWSRGYASEAAQATLNYGRDVLGMKEILAIVNNDNKGSIALLDKLGFIYQQMIALYDNEPEIRLYQLQFT